MISMIYIPKTIAVCTSKPGYVYDSYRGIRIARGLLKNNNKRVSNAAAKILKTSECPEETLTANDILKHPHRKTEVTSIKGIEGLLQMLSPLLEHYRSRIMSLDEYQVLYRWAEKNDSKLFKSLTGTWGELVYNSRTNSYLMSNPIYNPIEFEDANDVLNSPTQFGESYNVREVIEPESKRLQFPQTCWFPEN